MDGNALKFLNVARCDVDALFECLLIFHFKNLFLHSIFK